MIIKRTIDNSYVIEKNGLPYHVPNEGKFTEEWAEVDAYAQAHPDEVTLEYPPEPIEPTFEELVAAKRAEIWGTGDAILAAVKENFTQAEIESWSKQEQGAKDITAGSTTTDAAVFVANIAAARQISTATLVSKILANVAAYGALSAAVIGQQQRLDMAITAAATQAALDAVMWTK